MQLANNIVLAVQIIVMMIMWTVSCSYKNSKFNATHEREVVFSEEF